MTTYRIDLAYDGTDFHGYAKQPNVRTVQGDFETALFRMTGEVETVVAGRTDRGVHATAQVLSFVSAQNYDTGMILRSLNRQLGPEISVSAVAVVDDSFNARFSAIGRAYTYLVLNRDIPDPFLARTSLHYRTPLDLALMNKGVACLVGLHDFAAFCRKAPNRSTERRLDLVEWTDRGDGLLALDVAGSSFCHQMVRSLAQVSIEVGRGKIPHDAVQEILESKDRRQGKGAARAHGLTLVSVKYP
ncbi:MAG: tRNA pseudouridine(38-40) synthase TruA [bacterium]|nr:tRNA pseudouridine(38-40) synthase TruA [bacterium]MCP4965558.1 tRNA pseudouridine(38-40) synthase TruA [bacterium]